MTIRVSLQVDQALACIDYSQVSTGPVVPAVEEEKPVLRERIFLCDYFGLWRSSGETPFTVGKAETPHILVCIDGEGHLENKGFDYNFRKGDVLLLPAVTGTCRCLPHGVVSLLEISLPQKA